MLDVFNLNPERAKRGFCCVRLCRSRLPRGSKDHGHNGRFCRRCRELRYKLQHPETYCFNKLRNNARRRGHEFTLSFDEFVRLAHASGYLWSKGRFAHCLSIDRIDPSKGYVSGNVRVLTVSENARRAFAPEAANRPSNIMPDEPEVARGEMAAWGD